MNNYGFLKLILLFTLTLTFLNVNAQEADTVLINGQFYTVDDDNNWAEAVAVKDGIIEYVGSMDGINAYVGDETEVIDLEGKFAMPSFVESHLHPLSTSYAYRFTASLYDLHSHNEYIEAITVFAESHSEMEGIMGNGFDRTLYGELGPRKESLDSIDSVRPIGIISNDIHAMWVNSKALEMAGITSETPNPTGGIIVKDPDTGEPTGMLQEMPAMSLVWDILPAPTKEDYKTSLLWGQEFLNSAGITTAHDTWMEFDPNFYEAFNELANEGLLTVRFRGSWYIDPNSEFGYQEEINYGRSLSENFTHSHFQVNSFKFLADGTVEEGTALLIAPYTNNPNSHGIKNWNDNDMLIAFNDVDATDYQIHVHVIGDSATKYTLDALEQLSGVNYNRHSLAHIQLITPEDITRMGTLGVTAHMSPYWMTMFETYYDYYLPYLGEERANNSYPHKSMFDAGINITVASDWPSSEPNPIIAIYNGITRSNPGGEQLPPANQCVSLERMITAATINGAYANFLEDKIGSIEVGKKADIVVLSQNLFDIDTEEIPNVEIEMTFFEGKLVFDKNASEINNIPASITLKQNSPNPFNSKTTILFSLSKNQNIKLSILDIQGKEIAVIINRNMTTGKHSIEFDGSKLIPGQYFYKIETDDFTETKKMILLK